MPRELDRIASLEWLRVIASVGVIWFHTAGAAGRQLGYAGLPILIMLSVSLTAGRTHGDSPHAFVAKRARRLIVPWVFWSIVYLGFQLSRVFLKRANGLFPDGLATILVGPSIHLWYLPFAFAASLVAYALGKKFTMGSVHIRSLILGGLGVAALGACSFALAPGRLIAVPFAQWAFGLPAVLLGLAIGPLALHGSDEGGGRRWLLMGLGSVVTVFCVALEWFGLTALAVPYAIGVALVVSCLLLQGKAGPWAALAGSLTYGIYILHPLIGGLLTFTGLKTSVWWSSVAMVLVISTGVTALLRRTPLRVFL
jgi:peptidoglycan/LPS O-acetylase OafA/YrhL